MVVRLVVVIWGLVCFGKNSDHLIENAPSTVSSTLPSFASSRLRVSYKSSVISFLASRTRPFEDVVHRDRRIILRELRRGGRRPELLAADAADDVAGHIFRLQ